MKYSKYFMIAFISFFGLIFMDVNASGMNKTPFSITTNSSWKADYLNYAKKSFESRSSAVEWTNSNKSSHKMWFRVRNTTGTIKVYGSSLLNYKTTDAFRTDLTVDTSTSGMKYELSARRENIIDPTTTVSGLWMP